MKKTLYLQLFFASLCVSCGLFSCSSSRSVQAPFTRNQRNKNPYLSFFQKTLKGPSDSEEKLFHLSYSVFLENLSNSLIPVNGDSRPSDLSTQRPTASLNAAPTIFIHGNLSPFSVETVSKKSRLSDLEHSDWGPWWLDLIRAEMGAQVVAHSQGLRQYEFGHCVEAYTKTLAAPDKRNDFSPVRGSVPPEGNLTTAPATLSSESLETLSNYFSQEKWGPVDSVAVVTAETENSLLRFRVKAKNKNLYDLVEQKAQALNFRKESQSLKPAAKGCQRYLMAAQLFETEGRCLSLKEGDFALIPRGTEGRPTAKDFASENDLKNHMNWMCAHAAQAHLKNWTPFDRRSLALNLEQNPLLRERLRALVEEELKLFFEGYRMWLADQRID